MDWVLSFHMWPCMAFHILTKAEQIPGWYLYFHLFICFWEKIPLCLILPFCALGSSKWPQTLNPPAFTSSVLGLQYWVHALDHALSRVKVWKEPSQCLCEPLKEFVSKNMNIFNYVSGAPFSFFDSEIEFHYVTLADREVSPLCLGITSMHHHESLRVLNIEIFFKSQKVLSWSLSSIYFPLSENISFFIFFSCYFPSLKAIHFIHCDIFKAALKLCYLANYFIFSLHLSTELWNRVWNW
jgi:hypothetical protein